MQSKLSRINEGETACRFAACRNGHDGKEPARGQIDTHLLSPRKERRDDRAGQDVVWNTIEAQLDLNIARDETGLAKIVAQQADELLARKKYLEAYRQYCVAYQELVPVN